MRALKVLLFASAILSIAASAVSNGQVSAPDTQVRFAETASNTALNFRQGNLASLVDAKSDFTATGWAEFMRHLVGSLDDGGAPTFDSTFTPSGVAVNAKQDKGKLSLTIPGVLKHESRNSHGGASSTSYRAEIDVRVSASPFKIEMLVQRTCGGATTKLSCR